MIRTKKRKYRRSSAPGLSMSAERADELIAKMRTHGLRAAEKAGEKMALEFVKQSPEIQGKLLPLCRGDHGLAGCMLALLYMSEHDDDRPMVKDEIKQQFGIEL